MAEESNNNSNSLKGKIIGIIALLASIATIIGVIAQLISSNEPNVIENNYNNEGVIIQEVEDSNIHIGNGDTYFGD